MPTIATNTSLPPSPFVAGETHDLSKPVIKQIKSKFRSFATQTLKEKSTPKPPRDECPVCLKRVGDKNIVVTKCGHKFCSTCIFTNFAKSPNGHNCPMCRTSFAPAFCSVAKHTYDKVTTSADSVMNKFWREDMRLSKGLGVVQRQTFMRNGYQEYIQENGYRNVPYLQLMEYMRIVLANCRDKNQKINNLHGLMDEFICTTFSHELAEKMKVVT